MKNINSKSVNNTIKKSSKLMMIPIVLVLGACSTTYTPETDQNDQYDFSLVKTYNIVGDEQLKNPMFSDIDRNRLNTAIDSSMQQRGLFKIDEKQADVLVSYFVVTKDKIKVNSSYGAGYHGGSCYRCGYGSATYITTRNYVEGTLVIDIIDSDSKKSVYRSTLTKPLKSFDTVQEREQAMNGLVEKMIANFPMN